MRCGCSSNWPEPRGSFGLTRRCSRQAVRSVKPSRRADRARLAAERSSLALDLGARAIYAPRMTNTSVRLLTGAVLMAFCAARTFQVRGTFAQDIDPFPKPIAQNGEPVRVNIAEFATIPESEGE